MEKRYQRLENATNLEKGISRKFDSNILYNYYNGFNLDNYEICKVCHFIQNIPILISGLQVNSTISPKPIRVCRILIGNFSHSTAMTVSKLYCDIP